MPLHVSETCCPLRAKIITAIVGTVPEQICGVPPSAIADVTRFDLQAPGIPGQPKSRNAVVQFRFCPWCGKPYTPDSPLRLTNQMEVPNPESDGEEWKR